jgi:hypothetical protein
LKLSVEITLPLIPSHQGRGEILWLPLPWWERVGARGTNKIKCEGPLAWAHIKKRRAADARRTLSG